MSSPFSSGRARLGLLQVSLAGVLWGTGGLVMQLIRDREPMSVLVVSTWRMVLAAVVLFAALLVTRGFADLRRLLRQRPGTAVVVGCCTGAYQALYFGAVLAVGVSVSTVVALGLAPVLLTVAESITARKRPTRVRIVVLCMALGGLLLVSAAAGTSTTGPHPALGVVLAAASGATYALATGIGRPLTSRTSPLALTAATSTAGALALLP